MMVRAGVKILHDFSIIHRQLPWIRVATHLSHHLPLPMVPPLAGVSMLRHPPTRSHHHQLRLTTVEVLFSLVQAMALSTTTQRRHLCIAIPMAKSALEEGITVKTWTSTESGKNN